MKIKTITCHHVYNHGAYLQAYALITYLKSIGHDAEIINYRPDYLSQHFKLTTCNPRFSHIGLKWLYILAKLPQRLLSLSRKKVFDKFYQKYLPTTQIEYNNLKELQASPPIADCYIAGSDQIWNTTFRNGTDQAFYLNFGDKRTNRISYAASFATTKLKPGTEIFIKNALNNFNRISVREESGVVILNQLGFSGEIVVDPVFLLPSNHWSELATNAGERFNYILVYDFEQSDELKNITKRLAKKFNLKIFSVGPFRLKYANKNFINYGPETFIALIKNARFVISNSFHGTAFALIFNKDFFIVNRADGLNIRMHDISNRYGLHSRIVDSSTSDEQLFRDIDYAQTNTLLASDISKSKQFLQNSINKACL